MNIIFLADIVPYPPNTGIKIRTYNIIRELHTQGHNVFLLAFNHKVFINDAKTKTLCAQKLKNICKKVHIFEIPSEKNRFTHYLCLAKNLFEIDPYRVKRYQSKKCSDRIKEIILNNKIDLVHLDKTEFYWYSKFIDGIPIVATNHNVESNLMKQRSRYEISMDRKFFAFLQYVKTLRYERRSLNRVNGYITCTDLDRDFFRNELSINTLHETIDNGVDCSLYKPLRIDEDHYVLIIGAQNKESTANYDATMFFVKKMWPRIIEQDPSIELKIVGRNPDRSILELENKYKNVEVVGYIQDEKEVFAKSKVLIVPLRIGGGSRLKILTAMAMGKTVISTSKGAEGIAYENGKNILIADAPEDFATKVLTITQDYEMRRNIGEHAHKLATDRYDWGKIVERLFIFYQKILTHS